MTLFIAGTDRSDLPLDRYCHDLQEEIRFVISFMTIADLTSIHSYIIDRLPEGGEGIHGYDDGEGDD